MKIEFFKKDFSANKSHLSDAEENTSGLLKRGEPPLRTTIRIYEPWKICRLSIVSYYNC